MDELITYLRTVDESSLPNNTDAHLAPTDHSLVDEIRGIAEQVLITDEGTPDFDAIDRLYREHGYFVFPGERDRFGWVTGCIQTKKGIIVFG